MLIKAPERVSVHPVDHSYSNQSAALDITAKGPSMQVQTAVSSSHDATKGGYIFFDDAQSSSKTPSIDPSSIARHEEMIKTKPKAKDRADVAFYPANQVRRE